MSLGLKRADLSDLDFVDAPELESDAQTAFISGVVVVSTTSSTKTIVLSGTYIIEDVDQRVEPKDIVILTGTSGGLADGTYTVFEVIDDTSFIVVEAINDSTGGEAIFVWPPGALRVGFNPTGLLHTASHNVQGAITDLDTAIVSGGGLTQPQVLARLSLRV